MKGAHDGVASSERRPIMSTTKKASRVKSTEEQWRDIHSDWLTTGLSDVDYCKRNNYCIDAFRRFRKVLGLPDPEKQSAETKRTRFQVRSDASKQRWVRDDKKEAFWRQHIDARKRSSLSKRAYCKAKNLSESSFNAWCREIELRDREKVSTTNAAVLLADEKHHSSNPFVPLRLVASESKPEQPDPPASIDETHQPISILVPGGAEIRINDNCSVSFVAELYSSLKV